MSKTWGPERVMRRPARRHHTVASKALPFFVTDHAAERFRDRVRPTLPLARAKTELCRLAETARKTDSRSRRGDEIWIATTEPAVQFVVRRDARFRLPTCTTIYAPNETVEVEGDDQP